MSNGKDSFVGVQETEGSKQVDAVETTTGAESDVWSEKVYRQRVTLDEEATAQLLETLKNIHGELFMIRIGIEMMMREQIDRFGRVPKEGGPLR